MPCPAHLSLLDFVTRTILGEEYRSSDQTNKTSQILNYRIVQIVIRGNIHPHLNPLHANPHPHINQRVPQTLQDLCVS